MNNMKQSKPITYKGKTQSMGAWAREFGMSPMTFGNRYYKFRCDMHLVETAPRKGARRFYTYRGQQYSIRELAEMRPDLSRQGLYDRLQKMTVEEAMETPRLKSGPKNGPRFCGKPRPYACTEPECERCPYDDCKW